MAGPDDLREWIFRELSTALRGVVSPTPLAGFSPGQALGPVSTALLTLCREAAEAVWTAQLSAGEPLLQVSAAIAGLGFDDLNFPFVRDLQRLLERARDALVAAKEDEMQAMVNRVTARATGGCGPGPENQFVKREMWIIRFLGKETCLGGNLKGPAAIHYLIQHQGHPIHVIRMMADIAGAERKQINPAAEGLTLASGNTGDLLDEETIRSCEVKYDALVAEREHANEGRLAEIEEGISKISHYLSASMGLGGESRKAGDCVAKIRRRIARVISIAIEKINQNDPDLSMHLRNSIRTHTDMVYVPDREIEWVLA